MISKQFAHELSLVEGEKLFEEKVGSNYVHLSYLSFFDRQPIRFTFPFYRFDSKWRTQNMSFDASFTDEIKELADQKLLPLKP